MALSVLLIEDDDDSARVITRALHHDPDGFEVAHVMTARAGLAHLGEHRVNCVLLDYRLPDSRGLDALREIRKQHPEVPAIVLTGSGSEEVAVEAMKLGAMDYLVKQGRYVVTLPLVIREAVGRRELEEAAAKYRSELRTTRAQVTRLQKELRDRFTIDGIIGESSAIETVLTMAERAAQSRATVLLEGETGTGKDLVARAIHYHGARTGRPFLAQNCAALPEALLESELFGHVRGAFTGADRDRRGLFEAADSGTLFLDEISEVSLSIQAKLLRVLQDGEIRQVGGSNRRTVDVRVIAASNRNLREAVREGKFREDLYYRLQVFPITIPPLRERREDVRLLAVHFLEQFCRQEKKRFPGFEAQTLRAFERYDWPGNVRELENEIHRLVLCAEEDERIPQTLLSTWMCEPRPTDGSRPLREIVKEVEVATIRARLRQHGNHRSQTARSLGITRESLWAKMRQLGVGPGGKGSDEPK